MRCNDARMSTYNRLREREKKSNFEKIEKLRPKSKGKKGFKIRLEGPC